MITHVRTPMRLIPLHAITLYGEEPFSGAHDISISEKLSGQWSQDGRDCFPVAIGAKRTTLQAISDAIEASKTDCDAGRPVRFARLLTPLIAGAWAVWYSEDLRGFAFDEFQTEEEARARFEELCEGIEYLSVGIPESEVVGTA